MMGDRDYSGTLDWSGNAVDTYVIEADALRRVLGASRVPSHAETIEVGRVRGPVGGMAPIIANGSRVTVRVADILVGWRITADPVERKRCGLAPRMSDQLADENRSVPDLERALRSLASSPLDRQAVRDRIRAILDELDRRNVRFNATEEVR